MTLRAGDGASTLALKPMGRVNPTQKQRVPVALQNCDLLPQNCDFTIFLKHICLLTGWPKITAACPPLLALGMSGRQTCCVHTQSTLLLVEKAGVAPDLTLRLTAYKQDNQPGFETHGESHKVPNMGNQWPHK